MQVGRVQRKLNKRWCAAHFVSGSGQQRRRSRSDINPFYWQALYTWPHSVRRPILARIGATTLFHGVLDVIRRDMRHRRRWCCVQPRQDTRQQYQGRIKVASFQRHRCWSSVLRLFQWSACVSAPCAKNPSGWHTFGSAPRVSITTRALNIKSGLVCGGHGCYNKINRNLFQHWIPLWPKRL